MSAQLDQLLSQRQLRECRAGDAANAAALSATIIQAVTPRPAIEAPSEVLLRLKSQAERMADTHDRLYPCETFERLHAEEMEVCSNVFAALDQIKVSLGLLIEFAEEREDERNEPANLGHYVSGGGAVIFTPPAKTIVSVPALGCDWTVSMQGPAVYWVRLNGLWFPADVLASDTLDAIEARYAAMEPA